MGFLHMDIGHLLSNLAVMMFVGWNLERALGPWNIALIFATSVFGGSIFSIWMTPEAPSIGASGGVFGLVVLCRIRFFQKSNSAAESTAGVRLGYLSVLGLYVWDRMAGRQCRQLGAFWGVAFWCTLSIIAGTCIPTGAGECPMDTNLAVEHERAHVGIHGSVDHAHHQCRCSVCAHRRYTKGSNGSKISFLNLVHANGMGTTPRAQWYVTIRV